MSELLKKLSYWIYIGTLVDNKCVRLRLRVMSTIYDHTGQCLRRLAGSNAGLPLDQEQNGSAHDKLTEMVCPLTLMLNRIKKKHLTHL